jgi:hypothetical protein
VNNSTTTSGSLVMAMSDHFKPNMKLSTPSQGSSQGQLSGTPGIEIESTSSKDDPLKLKHHNNLLLLKQIEESFEESTPY